MFNGKIHYKWSFSIATLNYQRVVEMIKNMYKYCISIDAKKGPFIDDKNHNKNDD
jgi:hypothetical protein